MGWRDFQESVSLEFMESMELIANESIQLIPLIPLIPPVAISGTHSVPLFPEAPMPKSPHAPAASWQPEFKAWLTPEGELRTAGVCDDLAGEIIKLTIDNVPLQAKLLRLHVGRYSGPQWKALVEEWYERAAIMTDSDMTRHDAELAAAKYYRIDAFIDELRNTAEQ